ncbi:pectinesterase-like [Tripterygium wilfordii]|uniref:Pectinesterase-like n=1 Tax=Tripterygium wilfordii TaxID=458696 RepID=A0A7J7DCW3_TRIWF|nr:pectinesterase-like [Tripterygium wilfordii]
MELDFWFDHVFDDGFHDNRPRASFQWPPKFKIPSYLGRQWKRYSRIIIMESVIGDVIKLEGWFPWEGNFALDTLYYANYANH